jgi:hypothetical protein
MPASVNHRELARLGAIARLDQLEQERAAILKAFPGLDRSRARGTTPTSRPRRGGSQPGRKLSTAAKRRMSAGMRKWWAARRAGSKKQAGAKA